MYIINIMKRYIFKFALIFFVIFICNDLFSQNIYHTNLYVILDNRNHVDINIFGRIMLKQFYGPPNYGETPEIDKIESYYILQLYEPIIFEQGLRIETVEEIQLIYRNNINIEIITDWSYIIDGEAFFAETSHHHTPVIITINRITRND